MKKAGIFIELILIVCLLTSCQVRFSGHYYDVPWWLWTSVILLFSAFMFLMGGYYVSMQTFVCARCGERFSPRIWEAAFSLHRMDARVLRCPCCGYKGFCRRES